MNSYKLDGLECAQCANRIETELRKLPGLESAIVNFPMKTLVLEKGALDDEEKQSRVLRVIRKIEPGVSLAAAAGSPVRRKEITRLTVAGALFALGLGLEIAAPEGALEALRQTATIAAYLLTAYPIFRAAVRSALKGQLFNEMFLMAIASVGAIVLGELSEAAGVVLFYSVGEYLQDRAVERSRRSISELMNVRPEFARLATPEGERLVSPENLQAGDVVEIRPGERIPVDAVVEEGSSFVDTSSLTGESTPRAVGAGDRILAGTVNGSGRVLARAAAPFAQSAAARVLDLVENAAARKAPTERLISAVARYYTPAVVFLALGVAFLPPLFVPGQDLGGWVYRALVLLVISCPCALVISIPLGYFAGVGSASKQRVLVKGANYLDALLKVDTVVFDKTGTLTKGVFEVTRIEPAPGFSEADVLRWAAAAEKYSSHPIAGAICKAAESRLHHAGPADKDPIVLELVEEKGRGLSARFERAAVLAGNRALMGMHDIALPPESELSGGSVVHVAIDGLYAGTILVSDRMKDEAPAAISELRALGVRRIVVLSGDREASVSAAARAVGADEAYGELLPEDKLALLEKIQSEEGRRGKVAFVGDGMNDAPVLVRSDVGIAMGGLGSDAAIEASDIVVMDDNLSRIPAAFRTASRTRCIIMQNLVIAGGVKVAVLALGALGLAGMWAAVIADVGVALAAVMNSLRASKYRRPIA